MPGRKIRDEDDARACLSAVESSTLARAAWARSHGIDARSLNAWRLALERRARRDKSSGLFDLVPLGGERTRPAVPVMVVRRGDFAVDISRDVDVVHLGRVLQALAAC